MTLADVQAKNQECQALSPHEQAIREARRKLQALLTESASLDQAIAEAREGALESVKKFTDAIVAEGRMLIEQLVLLAHLTQHVSETPLDPSHATELTPGDQREVALQSKARRFLARCGESMEICLETLAIALESEDILSASLVCQHAQHLTAAMREIQDSWPWTDDQGVEESWRQYRHGELMDFETFKHELLKAAK